MVNKATILCVDDERNVVESMTLNLRRHYRVLTALSGLEGLEILRGRPDVSVVVSDMRMPEMDGAAFLAEVKSVAPAAVRMLLTGYSDIEAAMRAVNEGQIFRFLTKPCEPGHLLQTLAAGVEQHRLITAERVLLQKTLLGAVKAVVDLMGLDNPMALGRAVRIRDAVRGAAAKLPIEHAWRVELAALLSQLGAVSLPDETLRKLYDGEALEPGERRKHAESIDAIGRILHNIPRLEPVTDLLAELAARTAQTGGAASVEVELITAATHLDALEAQGHAIDDALDRLREDDTAFGVGVLGALAELKREPGQSQVTWVALEELTEGMRLCDDLKTSAGVLILPRGFAISASSREHVLSFADQVAARVKVLAATAPEPVSAERSA